MRRVTSRGRFATASRKNTHRSENRVRKAVNETLVGPNVGKKLLDIHRSAGARADLHARGLGDQWSGGPEL